MGIWGDVVQKVNGDVRGWREIDVARYYSSSTVVERIVVGEGGGYCSDGFERGRREAGWQWKMQEASTQAGRY